MLLLQRYFQTQGHLSSLLLLLEARAAEETLRPLLLKGVEDDDAPPSHQLSNSMYSFIAHTWCSCLSRRQAVYLLSDFVRDASHWASAAFFLWPWRMPFLNEFKSFILWYNRISGVACSVCGRVVWIRPFHIKAGLIYSCLSRATCTWFHGWSMNTKITEEQQWPKIRCSSLLLGNLPLRRYDLVPVWIRQGLIPLLLPRIFWLPLERSCYLSNKYLFRKITISPEPTELFCGLCWQRIFCFLIGVSMQHQIIIQKTHCHTQH